MAVSWLLCCKPHNYTEAQLCRPVVLNVFSHVHRVLCLCCYLKSKSRSAGFQPEGNTVRSALYIPTHTVSQREKMLDIDGLYFVVCRSCEEEFC